MKKDSGITQRNKLQQYFYPCRLIPIHMKDSKALLDASMHKALHFFSTEGLAHM